MVSDENKRSHMNKVEVACLAFVLFLGIGGVTVLENMKMDIHPHDYGQWVDYRNCGGWKKCKR